MSARSITKSISIGLALAMGCAASALTAPVVRASRALQAPADGLSESQREAAVAFDPRTLPRADDGRWREWSAATPPPDDVRAAFVLGARAYQEGDYAAVLAYMHDALSRAPDFPGALYQSAIAYFRLRRYGDCVAMAERFVEVVPREVGATQVLGHGYYSLGDYARARDHYRRVVDAAPSSVEAWRGLGLSSLRLGESEAALRALDKALELRRDHADALVWRAQALLELDRPKEALESALRGRDLAPYEPRTWFLLGTIFAELERAEDAAAARARFVDLNRLEQQVRTQEGLLLHDPFAIDPRVRLVRLNVAIGNAEEVALNLRRLQKLLPDSLDVALLTLEAGSNLRDFDLAAGAVADLEKRFAQAPQAWSAIEAYYLARGDEGQARRAAGRRAALGVESNK